MTTEEVEDTVAMVGRTVEEEDVARGTESVDEGRARVRARWTGRAIRDGEDVRRRGDKGVDSGERVEDHSIRDHKSKAHEYAL